MDERLPFYPPEAPMHDDQHFPGYMVQYQQYSAHMPVVPSHGLNTTRLQLLVAQQQQAVAYHSQTHALHTPPPEMSNPMHSSPGTTITTADVPVLSDNSVQTPPSYDSSGPASPVDLSYAAHRRRSSSDIFGSDTGSEPRKVLDFAHEQREATRRLRIEAEQKRRDALRDGYDRLRSVLPVGVQKSSKSAVLDRATAHILVLEKDKRALEERLQVLESEITRLRVMMEELSVRMSERGSASSVSAQSPPSDMPSTPASLTGAME